MWAYKSQALCNHLLRTRITNTEVRVLTDKYGRKWMSSSEELIPVFHGSVTFCSSPTCERVLHIEGRRSL